MGKTDLAKYNVLFVTLDCCRYDTALLAKTPILDEIGELRSAVTSGTFTLPAHMGFFAGYLPTVVEPPFKEFYSNEKKQLWRLNGSRYKPPSTIGLLLNGKNILEGYKRLGYHTVGVGGVRWFRNKVLTEIFDEFHFFGPADDKSVFCSRSKKEFALEHIDRIYQTIKGKDKWFLFVNCLETHVPYDCGEGPLPRKARNIINKAKPIWGGKILDRGRTNISTDELKSLYKYQVKALECIDRRLGRLLDSLPRPILAVVCGDHGECFGEDKKWGHGFPAEKVFEVPLRIGFVH